MSYASLQDIEKQCSLDKLLLVAADPVDPTQVDTEKVSENLRWACGVVDGYCGARYQIPLSTVPDSIRGYTVDLAMHRMATGPTLTDELKDAHEAAIKFLDDVARGIASLGVDQVDPNALATETPALRTAPPVPGRVAGGARLFTRMFQRGIR